MVNNLLLNRIEPEIMKVLRTNQNGFEKAINNITDSDNPSNFRRSSCKKL